MANREINGDNPFGLHQEIVAARSIEELRGISVRMLDHAGNAILSGISAETIVQLISRCNDAVTLRIISLLESREGIRLPQGATFLVLGSEGRGEQTLRTDQDNAIVYCDELSSGDLRRVERFATRIVDALEEIGVPRCPGNIMACNPRWCHSISEWMERLNEWIAVPTPENILNFGMFQDLRALHGNESPVLLLREHIISEIRNHGLFFPHMADHVVRFPAPLTIFGRIRVEHDGMQAGMVDLKKAGIFAITTGASLLALEFGIIGGNSWSKLEQLGKLGIISGGDLESIVTSFTFLVQLRLQQQLREISSGSKPTNYVDPRQMSESEQERFRRALKGVNTFLWIFSNHYQLDAISL